MTYQKKTVEDIDCAGKRIFIRCDFNVPLNENREITDDTRIKAALKTITYLLNQGASLIVCSHLGRPKGEFNKKYSLEPVAKRLGELIGQEVILAEDIVGPSAKKLASEIKPGQVVMLENIRFKPQEEKNEPEFAKELASLADLYVNEAFGAAHRAHASTAGIANYLPGVCGYLMVQEIEIITTALSKPERPFIAILGGSKVSDKIGVISNLIRRCDAVLIGGAMSHTFTKALGGQIGKSLCEEDKLEYARQIVFHAMTNDLHMVLPSDSVCAKSIDSEEEPTVAHSFAIPDDVMGLDIGPEATELYTSIIKKAKTVIWNGPMGVFEIDQYSKGTNAVAKAIAETELLSIIGGGDSAAAVEQMGYSSKISHISTGGGASLKLLEGKPLPGIECLQNKGEPEDANPCW